RRAKVATHGSEARQDARDVAVQHGERCFVGDAEDGGGGVTPDPWPSGRRIELARKPSMMPRDDLLRSPAQIPRAAVVAKPGPGLQYARFPRARQRPDARKFAQEPPVVGNYSGNARLLQHHLREPDAIGVAAAAPRKVAAICAEPAEEAALKSGQGARGELYRVQTAYSRTTAPARGYSE